jgi:hypothetical protein
MVIHASRAVSDATAAFWLESLKEAHRNLRRAIEELEQLTRGPLPSREHLIDVRWRVSEASLARRLLWGRIHAYLSDHGGAAVERSLRTLQEADIRLLRLSAKHVSEWTSEHITDNWLDYCRASEVMRERMTEAMTAEKRLLYPILEALGP